jgi:type VI secretion system secreted protein VgrG
LKSISTPLGEDYLLITRFICDEGISQLFNIQIEVLHEEDQATYAPTAVDPKSLLGQGVTIFIEAQDGSKREYTGMVTRFSQGNRDVRFSYYAMTVVPHVWLLTQKSQSKIYQQITVPDILKKVFKDFQVKYELQRTYEQRNYCVQYRETDFEFASRLMEEEGIFYFFVHADGQHEMVIADTPQSHRDCPGKSTIPFFVKTGDADDFIGAINTFLSDYHVQTGKVTMWDNNFQLPTNHLDLDNPSRFTFGENQKLEMYMYPGGYASKYDGIDKSGGEQASELQKIFPDRKTTVDDAMEALDARVTRATGRSDCCSIISGHRFSLEAHPNEQLNKQYVITSSHHEAQQSPSYVSEEELNDPYTNTFDCILYGAGQPSFRPLKKHEKPVIVGSQTAFVVGPSGEEIFTDKYGRVKVQFHWDRDGKADAGSSCWVRVAQTWAGNKWGGMYIPRIGMEVVVSFLEGDPDQPIITGCVYNPGAMPPYTLPDEKTKSTLKSNSSKGGGGFNEFRIEDKKGSEQIFIHAEKNQDNRVKNDSLEWIGHDRHLIIENEQFEKVKLDKHMQVVGDHNEKVGGTMSLTVGSDLQEKVSMNYALDAGMAVHIKAGMTAVIEAGTSLTLKVGGNFININPGGVFISGTMVMINSGGAAGSGAGSSPTSPTDPKEADKADPGERIPAPEPAPPEEATSFGPLAKMMKSAAESGAPFCDT